MNRKVELVISRHNEDVSWSHPYKDIRVIYNTGDEIFVVGFGRFVRYFGRFTIRHPRVAKALQRIGAMRKIETVALPDIDREAYAYLHHIIKNWDNLADTTVFCQADCLKHSPDFLKLMKKIDKFKLVQPLGWRWCEWNPAFLKFENIPDGIPPLSMRNIHKENHIDDCRIFVEFIDRAFITIEPYYFRDWGIVENIRLVNEYKEGTLKYLWERLGFPEEMSLKVPFCYGSIFAVKKERIKARGIKFYEGLMDFVIQEKQAAWILERLWLTIFGYKG